MQIEVRNIDDLDEEYPLVTEEEIIEMITNGGISFAPGVEEQLQKDGRTKEDLIKALRRSLGMDN